MLILTLFAFYQKWSSPRGSMDFHRLTLVVFVCCLGVQTSHASEASQTAANQEHVIQPTQTGVSTSESSSVEASPCSGDSVHRSLQAQFNRMKRNLEFGYQQGIPSKLKNRLLEIRSVNDRLSSQVLDSGDATPQEIQALIQGSLDHIDRFIDIIPTLTAQAPQVLEELVLPLTNFEQDTKTEDCDGLTEQITEYKTVASELERLNAQLFIVQSLAPQKFLAYRMELQNLLSLAMSDNPTLAKDKFQAHMPMIINNLQLEVDKVLPTFTLSAEYSALAF